MDPTTHRLIAAAGSGQIRDADFENTVLLLHGDGTNGAQNNTFIDGSTNNFTITRNGNTTQGSFNPYGDRWSNYFDGTTDHLQISRTTSLLPGASTDFSVEAWVYLTSYNAQNSFICGYYNRGVTSDWEFQITSTGLLLFYFANGNTTVNSGANTVGLNQWVHVAACRSGTGSNNVKIYINGVERGSGTTNNSTSNGTALNFTIGGDTGGDGNMLFGYISNLRVVNGTAAYTSAFTPSTTPLTAITNTSLLTCQSNRFVDNSATPLTLTRNGDVRVTNFNPFGLANPYSTSNDGGSGYFDTSGDLLSVSNAAFDFGSGDFTIEMWVYCLSASPTLFRIGSVTDQTSGVMIYQGGLYVSSNNSTWNVFSNTAVNIPANCFTHIALVRNGSAWNFYRNGVSVASTTASVTMSGTSAGARIGGAGSGGSETAQYFSDVRVVKGTAVYTGNFTPPTLKPLAASGADSAACYSSTTNVNTTFAGSNTSLLLNFTNAGIYDQTEQNVLETVGNAQISTTQKKFGTGALYFDGTGDYLSIPDSAELDMVSEDLTIETWFYVSAFAASSAGNNLSVIVDKGGVQGINNPNYSLMFTNSSGNIKLFGGFYAGGTPQLELTGATTIQTATWYHAAMVRNGNTGRLYLNGSQDATGTLTGNMTANTGAFLIGYQANAVSRFYFNGYIDDLRITKGVARTITVPTAPYPDF